MELQTYRHECELDLKEVTFSLAKKYHIHE